MLDRARTCLEAIMNLDLEVFKMLLLTAEAIQEKLIKEAKKHFSLHNNDADSDYITHFVNPSAHVLLAKYLHIPPLDQSIMFLMVAKNHSHAVLFNLRFIPGDDWLTARAVIPGGKVIGVLEDFQEFILEPHHFDSVFVHENS